MNELEESIAMSLGSKELQIYSQQAELNELRKQLAEEKEEKEKLVQQYESLRESVEGKSE